MWELVIIISATLAHEAKATAPRTAKNMALKALKRGRYP